MVNFSANNLKFLNTETHPLPEGRANAYKSRHAFKDMHTQRTYRFFEYHDTEAPPHTFSEGTRYVVNGLVNCVGGAVIYLVMQGAKLDAKNNDPVDAEKLRRQIAD
jgi:hypothetical protein